MSPPRAIAFDVYGTLLDIESMRETVLRHTAAATPFIDVWRGKQLQYAFLATLMDRYADFDALTAAALDFAAAQFKVRLNAAARNELLAGWRKLKPFPDVARSLGALRGRDIRLAVLSNGTPASLGQAIEFAGLGGAFEVLLSVDAVGAYKPRPEAYQLAVEHFALAPDEIGFVSSHGWDATGAAEFGLTVFWCNRRRLPGEKVGQEPAATIASLDELPEAIDKLQA